MNNNDKNSNDSGGKIRLVYLLAASHSGSTLLAMLLGAHPDMCTVGELKATSLGNPSEYRCSCLETISKCSFWQAVKAEMAKRGFDFEVTNAGTDIRTGATPYIQRLLRPLHRGPFLEVLRDCALMCSPTWRKNLPLLQQRNKALLESLSAVTGKRIIVDSSKIGIRLKYMLRVPGIDVRVVRAVRDGRGVALTYMDPGEFADASNPDLKGGGTGKVIAKSLTMENAAREWRRSNEEANHIVNALPDTQTCRVHYEELCDDPEKTLRRLFSFIGADPDRMVLDFRSVEHHVVGNGMRLDSTSKISLDERWRKVLTPDDLAIFNRVAGAMSKELGYD